MTAEMTTRAIDPNKSLIHLNQILLSLNIGLAVSLSLKAYISQFPAGRNRLADIFLRLVSETNGYFHLDRYDVVGVNTVSAALAAGLVLSTALLLYFLATSSQGRAILNLATGLAAIAAMPACWLYSERILSQTAPLSLTRWFVCGGLPLACVVWYFYAAWRIPVWSTISILMLYYGFWGWMLWQNFAYRTMAVFFPVMGVCSSIAWGLLVSRQRLVTR